MHSRMVDEVNIINSTIAHFMRNIPHPSGIRLPPSPRGRLTDALFFVR